MNIAEKLFSFGQSIWYDNIQRNLLENGEFAGMIERNEIRGVTSNPSIFMNAITKSKDYDTSLAPFKSKDYTAEEVFFSLAIEDIQKAADLFMPLYLESKGRDGYVSLEVSPYIAYETTKTIEQAKALWQRVNRPNLMIKIPATKEGMPAITEAIAAGINVNVTLIFALDRYSEVMDAYLAGLERRVEQGEALGTIASVASFFVSRVDTNIDARLVSLINGEYEQAKKAEKLLGKAAIANAKLAYQHYKKIFTSERFIKLQEKGAKAQRPLWASTSTKNPFYRDVIYVEELVGDNTVNTVPPQTLTAFLQHGAIRNSLTEDIESAVIVLENLEKLGISMAQVTTQLEDEGVKAFADAFTVLLKAIDERRFSS